MLHNSVDLAKLLEGYMNEYLFTCLWLYPAEAKANAGSSYEQRIDVLSHLVLKWITTVIPPDTESYIQVFPEALPLHITLSSSGSSPLSARHPCGYSVDLA